MENDPLAAYAEYVRELSDEIDAVINKASKTVKLAEEYLIQQKKDEHSKNLH
ncbi:hypothetical protein [Photobacterium leiognathi]|uniref:hypothetical protein n=1 Tax=Photobacterium leiognathi TaxID=553611 RepID=UPI00298123CC|nr:hypothetical protein [Photobacterium leiognathi]